MDLTLSDGSQLGSFEIDHNKSQGWRDWYLDTIDISLPKGDYDLKLQMRGHDDYLFNLEWLKIEDKAQEEPVAIKPMITTKPKTRPNMYNLKGELKRSK